MIFSLKKYKDNLLLHRYVNLLSVDILIKASGFILLPVYLKLLTQREFGLYNYLISIVAFFSQVLNFGLFVSQSKIYPQLETNEKGVFIYNIQILLFLLLSPTLFIIYIFHIDNFVISLLFKSPIDYSKYRFSLLLAIISSIYSFMLYNYLLTAERIKYVQRYNLIRLVLLNSIVLMVLYFYKDDRVNARILTTYIIEIALVAIFSYHYVKEMSPVVRKDQIVRSMKIGFPIMFSAICGVVINFGDKFLLEKHSGFIDLSVYYLAFSIANVIPLVFTTFQNIWLPIFHKERDLTKNLAMTKKNVFQAFIRIHDHFASADCRNEDSVIFLAHRYEIQSYADHITHHTVFSNIGFAYPSLHELYNFFRKDLYHAVIFNKHGMLKYIIKYLFYQQLWIIRRRIFFTDHKYFRSYSLLYFFKI